MKTEMVESKDSKVKEDKVKSDCCNAETIEQCVRKFGRTFFVKICSKCGKEIGK